jgi:hypothetical protein
MIPLRNVLLVHLLSTPHEVSSFVICVQLFLSLRQALARYRCGAVTLHEFPVPLAPAVLLTPSSAPALCIPIYVLVIG